MGFRVLVRVKGQRSKTSNSSIRKGREPGNEVMGFAQLYIIACLDINSHGLYMYVMLRKMFS